MFFRKGRKHRKRNKTKDSYFKKAKGKLFGLTQNEMDSLVMHMASKPKIPVVSVR